MCLLPLGIIIFHKPVPGVAGVVSFQRNVSLSSMDYSGIFLEKRVCYDWQALMEGFNCAVSGSKFRVQSIWLNDDIIILKHEHQSSKTNFNLSMNDAKNINS